MARRRTRAPSHEHRWHRAHSTALCAVMRIQTLVLALVAPPLRLPTCSALLPMLPMLSNAARESSRPPRSRPPEMLAPLRRRELLLGMVAAAPCTLLPSSVLADSSNKFTTRTTAKRRYYGRVKQGVFEFLAVGAAVDRGELQSADVTNFFTDTLQTRAAGTKTRCEGGGDACTVSQRLESRWDDMQTAMSLLGNAFRTSGGTAPPPPDKVKQVREAKAFATQVERLRRAAASDNRKDAALAYAAAVDALVLFLNDVDLPPPDDAVYRRQADTDAASLCQGGFCL